MSSHTTVKASFEFYDNAIHSPPGIPKNGSVPSFRSRKTSESSRYQPSLNPIKASSRGDLEANNGDVRNYNRNSRGSIGSKYSDDFVSIQRNSKLFSSIKEARSAESEENH